MNRFALAGMIAILGMGAFAQQQPPWSEQLPQPQRPAPGQYPQGPPPQYQGPQGPGPNAGPTDDQGDAPDRGVSRISTMMGNVSVRRGDSGELVAAVVNAPLVAGDRIVTSDAGRAEVQFDFANLIRLGPLTEVRLSELAYHRYQIQVATGTTIFRVVRDNDAQVEISTPSVAVRPVKAGVYRVSVLPDGTSQITVRLGDAEVFSPRGSEPLRMGQTMVARGAASDPEFQLSTPVADDEFERWCISRDQVLERSPSARHMSPDVAGAEDLDGNGHWVNDGQYGNVWAPAVGADPGWAPYSCGRWVWLDYYGWSWVGCESWGWAPYHYGRWYHASFGWAWWPGPAYGPYYWRPALVGFFGWGGGVGFGVGFGFGNLGWVALGPGEFFRPWYGRGFYGGFRGAGVVNVNAMAAFRNARFTNAVSSMRAGDFGRTGVSSANMVRPGAADLARAGAVHGQLPVTPSRESTQFSNRAASTQGMPHTSEDTRFASHMQTSQSNRMSFDQQQRGMSQGMSRASGAGGGMGGGMGSQAVHINPQIVQNRGAGGAGTAATGARSGVGSASSGGWQHFDPSANRGAGSSQPSGGMRQGTPQSPGQNGAYRGGQYGSQQGSQAGRGYSQPQSRGYSQPQSGNSQQRGASSGSSGSTSSGSSGASRPSSSGGSRGSSGGKGRH
jgi:FecR protein